MIIPQETLAHVLAERLGGVFEAVEPMGHGMAHRMVAASWQQNDGTVMPVMIRFFRGRNAHSDAAEEADALRELCRTSYPVPELYLLVDDTGEEPFTVMQRLPGETLTQVARTNPDRISYWLDKASHLLLRLHGIRWQDGYNTLKPVLAPLDYADRQVRWWSNQAATLHAADLVPAFDWLRANLYQTRASTQQTLVHGDFHPDNILVEGDKITGVLDWDSVTIADPAVDVAWTRLPLTVEANADVGDLFTQAYMRRNPAVGKTLPFWEMFAVCRRLTTIAAVKAGQSERMAIWSDAPDLARLIEFRTCGA